MSPSASSSVAETRAKPGDGLSGYAVGRAARFDRLVADPGGHEQVEDIQRARILSAMVDVAAEVGFIGAAVAPVVARAGVSRRTFYELFTGREDCFLAAFEWAAAQMRRATMAAEAQRRASWRERVRHSLAELLACLEAEPQLARVCVIEALAAGRLVLERRALILQEVAEALEADAPQGRDRGGLPLQPAEGIVGGAFSVIHGRVLAGQGLTDLHGQLMALIVLPYLGPRAAAEELARPAPEVRRPGPARSGSDGVGRLMERLEMRLTYRTVRCLMFIDEHPACSNREIAIGAEMSDEGQASKLLARLTRLGLILNSQDHGPGHPNRWTLTQQGRQVLGAVRGR